MKRRSFLRGLLGVPVAAVVAPAVAKALPVGPVVTGSGSLYTVYGDVGEREDLTNEIMWIEPTDTPLEDLLAEHAKNQYNWAKLNEQT